MPHCRVPPPGTPTGDVCRKLLQQLQARGLAGGAPSPHPALPWVLWPRGLPPGAQLSSVACSGAVRGVISGNPSSLVRQIIS